MSFNFKIYESDVLKGVWIIKPTIAYDQRGNIWTSFLKDKIEKILPDCVESDQFGSFDLNK